MFYFWIWYMNVQNLATVYHFNCLAFKLANWIKISPKWHLLCRLFIKMLICVIIYVYMSGDWPKWKLSFNSFTCTCDFKHMIIMRFFMWITSKYGFVIWYAFIINVWTSHVFRPCIKDWKTSTLLQIIHILSMKY